jgi:hypothetical protein
MIENAKKQESKLYAFTDSRAGVPYEHVFLPPKLVVRGSTIKIAPMSSSRPNHHHFKAAEAQLLMDHPIRVCKAYKDAFQRWKSLR